MPTQGTDGKWQGSGGGSFNTREEALRWDNAHKNKGGGGGGEAGILIVIFLIVPVLLAKVLGFIVGIFLKLGIVGRVVLTGLFSFALWIVVAILISALPFDITGGNKIISDIIGYIALAFSLFIGVTWFWRKHYPVIKNLTISDFSELFKWSFAICFYGSIILTLIFQYGLKMKSGMGFAIGIAFIAGVVFYLLKTRNYVPGNYLQEEQADSQQN